MATDLWYKDAVFYELHVKAFYDSNGDGLGDFRGLYEKLDYLQYLGVNCIWLLPFYPSPLWDDGYDVSDYFDVHPFYGTLTDFKTFLKAAHQRGMRVLTDLVLNHTSDQHPWFQEARRSPRSRKRNYYVWSDTDQKYADTRILLRGAERSNWTWDSEAKAFYWHRFFSHQPDLNFDNSAVRRAMLKVIHYWLDMGVDGFRVDAAPFLFEREGTNCESLPETHAYIKELRRSVNKRYSDRILLAEANQGAQEVLSYLGNGDEFHMAFNFPVMPRLFMMLRQEDRQPLLNVMAQIPDIPSTCQWGLFLRNHDELTLEMVSEEERAYMYAQYGPDPHMRLYWGIRRRLAPLLDNNRARLELLNSIVFSLPGSPIIYYGDELGMGDNVYLNDRDGVRTPMQWSGDRNAGFSRVEPARLYSPVIADPVYGYQAVNVEAQMRTSSSLLHWMRQLIQLRKQYPVFGRGTVEFLEPVNRKILAYIRADEQQTILVVNNLASQVQPVELDLQRYAGMILRELFGGTTFPPITSDRPYFLSLGPNAFYWFRLEQPEPGAAPEIT